MTNLVTFSVIMPFMRTVKIGALKAKLSAHIQYVKNGEEIIVCERDTPVAKIVPIRVDNLSEHHKRLIALGLMVPPKKKRDPKAKWLTNDLPKISEEAATALWDDERGIR
jgi:antitoxin (DNA-binding transcriptional repressor) of toxin-antitoxin stability system